MNSPCHCAEDTIAKSNAAAMKLRGGGGEGLIQVPRLARCGWKRIRKRHFRITSLLMPQALRSMVQRQPNVARRVSYCGWPSLEYSRNWPAPEPMRSKARFQFLPSGDKRESVRMEKSESMPRASRRTPYGQELSGRLSSGDRSIFAVGSSARKLNGAFRSRWLPHGHSCRS